MSEVILGSTIKDEIRTREIVIPSGAPPTHVFDLGRSVAVVQGFESDKGVKRDPNGCQRVPK